jgi:hypothetical protein
MLDKTRRTRLRRFCLALTVLAAIWASTVALTGGFSFRVNVVRLSSTNSRNALIIALLSATLAWALAPRGERCRTLTADWTRLTGPVASALGLNRRRRQIAHLAVATGCVVVVALGLFKGATAAGGADSYGYVSQAHLWATGTLRDEQPLRQVLTWPFAPQALAPFGYIPLPERAANVPVYAPGLPLIMAGFERLLGRHAVFYVVPLLGGLALWATYLMGAYMGGRVVGVAAATLLATSPVFLFQLMFPMSDVPVTAWWALSLALLPLESRGAALGAGLSAGAAILTRPNLVPLLAVETAYLAWHVISARALRRRATQHALLFAAGVVPACLGVAALHNFWYGSPFRSGYGGLDSIYRWEYFWPNLASYSQRLLNVQTPAVLIALAAPFLLWRRPDGGARRHEPRHLGIVYLCFIAATFGCYLFYEPYDAWWFLRFLLPAFPPLFVLTSVALVASATRFVPKARDIAIAALVGVLAWHGVRYSRNNSVFSFREGERKYQAIGDYIARRLPENAVLLSVQHAGSARYYSGRLTVRFSAIPSEALDSVIDDLRRLGYQPYILLENWEEAEFRNRFQEYSRVAALDWRPVAVMRHASAPAIYDPADKHSTEGPQRVTEIID